MNSREVKNVSGVWQDYWKCATKAKVGQTQIQDGYAHYFWGEHLEYIVPVLRDQCRNMVGLEVGVGTGILLERVQTKIKSEIVGLDISRAAVGVAKRRVTAPILVLADAFHVPFRHAVFDFLVCLGLIEHFRDSVTPLKKMLLLLKRKGYAFISVPQRGSLYAPWKRWQMRRGIWPFGFEREFAEEDLKQLCQMVGLADTRIVGVDFYPSFLKILPFEVFFRSLIVRITKWLETRKRKGSRFAHMLMVIAKRRH